VGTNTSIPIIIVTVFVRMEKAIMDEKEREKLAKMGKCNYCKKIEKIKPITINFQGTLIFACQICENKHLKPIKV
jgi:hypothetical protein